MRCLPALLAVLVSLVPARALAQSWFGGDLHTHSVHSWDAAELGGDDVARCLRLGEKQGLSFLSITDHQSVAAQADPAFASAKLTPVPGEEWGIMGHAGIHGTRVVVPEVDVARPPETWNGQVELALSGARGRGSVVVVNHPPHPQIVWAWTTSAFDAVEVWNAGWMFPFVKPTSRETAEALLKERGLAEVTGALSRELAEALGETSGGFNAQSVRFWEAHLERGAQVAAVGGGDRHVLIAPGYPTTWIRAGDRRLESLLDAVRRGRTGVTRSPLVPPAELAVAQDGAVASPGDTVRAGRPVTLQLRARVATHGLAVFYRGRTAIATVRIAADRPVASVNDLPPGPSWYRAEVLEPILDLGLSAADRLLWDRLTAVLSAARPDDIMAFLTRFGERVEDEGRWPSYRLPERVNRLVNLDPKRRGYCKSMLTSPVYVR